MNNNNEKERLCRSSLVTSYPSYYDLPVILFDVEMKKGSLYISKDGLSRPELYNKIRNPPRITFASETYAEKTESISSPNTVNDSLERIGTSLQNLIEEAQASLINTTHYVQKKMKPEEAFEDSIANYSYRYVQNRYMQSQAKLNIAIQQLEQSIQLNTMPSETTSSLDQKRKYIPWVGLASAYFIYTLSQHSRHRSRHFFMLFAFLFSSFSRKSSFPVISRIDQWMARLALLKVPPSPMFACMHIAYVCFGK